MSIHWFTEQKFKEYFSPVTPGAKYSSQIVHGMDNHPGWMEHPIGAGQKNWKKVPILRWTEGKEVGYSCGHELIRMRSSYKIEFIVTAASPRQSARHSFLSLMLTDENDSVFVDLFVRRTNDEFARHEVQ